VIWHPFELAHREGHVGVYRALGGCQVLMGIFSVVNIGPSPLLLRLHGLGLLLRWVFVEGRYLYRLEQRQGQAAFPRCSEIRRARPYSPSGGGR